jgi:anti-sigma factor RsiW
MHNCHSLDSLVTPFVDDELPDADRRAVEDHLRVCAPCHSRVAAERAVHDLLRARRAGLCRTEAPDALHLRCAALVEKSASAQRNDVIRTATAAGAPATDRRAPGPLNRLPPLPRAQNPQPGTPNSIALSRRLAPVALAASLVVVVGGAFVYQATDKSARVMAAELVADHTKCFALNSALATHQAAWMVEQSMAASFDWRVHLPDEPSREGLELVGARPCLYGEGRIAHIMYRHDGHPVSLFMLPKTVRAQELVEVLGHEAKIWCANNRTFVLVAREPRRDVERIASFVQASLR